MIRSLLLVAWICLWDTASAQVTNPLLLPDNIYALQKIPFDTNLNCNFKLPVSLSLKAYCPPVANQADETCFAYAVGYAGRSVAYNASHHLSNSGKQAFSPGLLVKLCQPRKRFNNSHCTKSGHIADACVALQETGEVPIALYQQECSCKSVRKLLDTAAHYKAKCRNIVRLQESKQQKTTAIKNSLASGHPVVVAFLDFASFDHAFGKQLWTMSEAERKTLDTATIFHTACIIGYNDSLHNGSFQIMNSWGTKWGDNGFIWIPYADMAVLMSIAISIEEPE